MFEWIEWKRYTKQSVMAALVLIAGVSVVLAYPRAADTRAVNRSAAVVAWSGGVAAHMLDRAAVPGLAGTIELSTVSEVADVIDLPTIPLAGDVSVEEAIWRRRSVRNFHDESLSTEIVSRLLWAAQGITEPELGFRSAPSAGATYPLEILVATEEYLARYLPEKHRLTVLHRRDVRKALAEACLEQEWVEEAPVVFIFIAEIARTAWRYGREAERYVLIEVGCASENLMLQAAALGLGSVPVGAFEEEDVQKVLDLPEKWEPMLVVPVGVPAE